MSFSDVFIFQCWMVGGGIVDQTCENAESAANRTPKGREKRDAKPVEKKGLANKGTGFRKGTAGLRSSIGKGVDN